jgi:hypothetical protein
MLGAHLVMWSLRVLHGARPTGSPHPPWAHSILAIGAPAACALGARLRTVQHRTVKHRRAVAALLQAIISEFDEQMWLVETEGQGQTRYVAKTFEALERRLAEFPAPELDDAQAVRDIEGARRQLRALVDRLPPHIAKPRQVWELLADHRAGFRRRTAQVLLRFGQAPPAATTPVRQFGEDPVLALIFAWDQDGNPAQRLGGVTSLG